MVDTADLPYRRCVGVALFDDEGRVFVGERLRGPGEWQMPQGGIDDDEPPERAARRELAEETGVRSVEPLARTEGWLRYDLPGALLGRALGGRYRGQAQQWFAFRLVDAEEIDLGGAHAEFRRWRFVPLDEAVRLIVDFKRPVYEAVGALFAPVAAGERGTRGEVFAERGEVRALWWTDDDERDESER